MNDRPGHSHDHTHDTDSPATGRLADFVDEMFRVGAIDKARRDLLRQGLAARAGINPGYVSPGQPASRGIEPGHAAMERAVKSGLILGDGPGKHLIRSGPETVHWGYLWGAAEPVLRIKPGETVTMETVSHEGLMGDQGPPEKFFARFGIDREQVLADAVAVYTKVQHSGLGPHVVTGPIYVEGAEPGDTLAVHVVAAKPRVPYGVNTMRSGKGGLPDEFTLNRSVVIPFDEARGVAKFAPKIEIPLKPFFGIMAVGPARSMGKLSSVPPGTYGGNIDLKDLTAGSTLYLPVHVPGALFMAGDGHAAQGDGEVDLTAIETSMTGTFRFELIKGKTLAWPRAETPDHWICLGLHENLDEAMRMCIRETVNFLAIERGMSRVDAYALASIGVDFEVTQVVDQVKGIHAMIPKAIFK